jgi:4-alpha-glucanotransferase
MTNPPLLEGWKTGVAVPVSALRSESCCGIGEFLDIPLLGSWCQSAGIDLIQLLPVNDTGSLSSPYSALSAFALHPVYIRLSALPGFERVRANVEAFADAHADRDRVAYRDVYSFKLDTLRRLFAARRQDDRELNAWIEENAWVHPYAVYHCLKQQNGLASWQEWPEYRDPTEAQLPSLWASFGEKARFHAWVQMHLERQLISAVTDLEKQGVYLKGDIPILMNEDSADVWYYRDYFDLSHRAGAPPDMYTRTGQHWGFPTYDWDALERQDFEWWRKRLERASLFYHAFRIDHVLGFFRIWSVPASEMTALLGYYRPALDFTDEELLAYGFERSDITLLTSSVRTIEEIDDRFGARADHVRKTYFEHGPVDGLVRLRVEPASEKTILALKEDPDIVDFLLTCYRDRTLLQTRSGAIAPFWYYDETTQYEAADDDTRARLDALVDEFKDRSDPVWEANGRRLLSFVRETTDMLACAEDLGEVPPCVPRVLRELGILGLKVERWVEHTEGTGVLVHPSSYPYLTVSTPGVHDTSSIRGWWQEEQTNRQAYCEAVGTEECPPVLTPELAESVIRRNLQSGSAICVFQLQDLFSIEDDLRVENPDDERINVPGTSGDSNWSYRMPLLLEDLVRMKHFAQRIHELIQENRGKSPHASGPN